MQVAKNLDPDRHADQSIQLGKHFKNQSVSYASPEISESEMLEWEAPDYLKSNYPYYISGYTNVGSPVFVVEHGKWNYRSAVEGGPEKTAELDKWLTQMYLRWRTTGNDAPGSPGSIVIVDNEGLGLAQLGHVGVVQLLLKQFPKFQQIAKLSGIKKIYVINANQLFERVWEMGKPMLGQAAKMIEFYGTNSGDWKAEILKQVPAKELPAWYGGSSSHEPVKVFG